MIYNLYIKHIREEQVKFIVNFVWRLVKNSTPQDAEII